MKRKVLVSLLVIAVVVGLVGASTWAYFSSEAVSTDNTFTAGTLDLELLDADDGWADPVTATWAAPNWAPGDPEVIFELSMRNMGSIGADLVAIRGDNLVQVVGLDGYNNIADNIHITTIRYTEGGSYLYGDLSSWYEERLGDGDGTFTLREFVESPYSMVFWIGGWPPPEDYLPALGARAEKLELGFTFTEDAGNNCQGDQASFDLTVTAAQSYNQITLLGKGPGVCYGYTQVE